MTRDPQFAGVIAPVLTPFGEDGSPDGERYLAHCQWLMAEGCTGLAPFGTTSEGNSLGLDERMELLEALVDGGIDAQVLMPGTGSCSLADAVVLTRHAVDLGCGGVLMLPPFYYKAASEEGLLRFFGDVIEGVGDDRLKIYLYHIPPVAHIGFSLRLIGRLIEAFPDTVVGLKDSSGDWANTAAILAAHPGFAVFPGSEVFLLEGLRHGGAGCISATCNISAAAIRRVYDQWKGGEADGLQEEITALRKAIQAFPMIPALKALIAHYRGDSGWARVRPPFEALPAAQADQAIRLLADAHNFRLNFAKAA
jgi:4-hydroxy-tetrahydrodipicolinate synthase